MIVYWDLSAAWNFALDYLLLLGTLRLAGRPIYRKRVALAAALGAAYSVAALAAPALVWALLPMALLMCRVAFGRAPRLIKLSLLFLLLACALSGLVVLLGRLGGGMARLARGVVLARLPWGVFCAAMAGAYVLLTVIFRAAAKHDAADFVTARVEYGGAAAELRLLRDTGNDLCDPLTGEGVPVLEADAVSPLGVPDAAFAALRVSTVGGGGTLRAFRCDDLRVDGRSLGARLVALTPERFGGAYQGLWFAEETEEGRKNAAELVG